MSLEDSGANKNVKQNNKVCLLLFLFFLSQLSDAGMLFNATELQPSHFPPRHSPLEAFICVVFI